MMERKGSLWLPLLLADPSPCLRQLVLRDLLHRADNDPEVRELDALSESEPLITSLCASQRDDGSWVGRDLEATSDTIRTTALALARLGYMGCGSEHDAVRQGAAYLYTQQQPDGSWMLPSGREVSTEHEGYSMMPLQTALPLRGLAMCGYAEDPRSENAYEWLLAQRLEDGAWPTGVASGVYGYVAGYRRLAHSRWGCRSNTTGALVCLAHHSQRCRKAPARRALDLLLGRETRERHALGYEIARLVGAEPTRGFLTFYARFDSGLLLDLCWRVGASTQDDRVADLVSFVREAQGPYGLWEYAPRPQVSRWVTFDMLRSLSRLDRETDWVALEPRTPFQPYPSRHRRY